MTTKDRTPVAGVLVTKCTKCKLETGHVVMAHNRKNIVTKVKCKSCGNEHRYYSEEKRALTRQAKERSAARASHTRNAQEYARLMEQHRSKKEIPYSMVQNYETDDIILHKTFGKGFIIKVYPQKMDVLFETGPRMLACNR